MINGSKGGGGSEQRPPIESPDSLISVSYAKILDLTSEGDIEGLVNGMASVYLSETPMMSNGQLNFSGVELHERKGTQDQAYISGFPASESELGVNVTVELAKPVVRSISNSTLSAVRIRLRVPRLTTQDQKTGDITGGNLPYRIELQTDGAPWQVVVDTSFNGKTTTGYDRSHRIDLPFSRNGWQIRVSRLTLESSASAVSDQLIVSAITEVIDAKFRYPNSALIGMTFDASQFSDIPSRAFHLRGRIIRVPSNYDPATRTYSGVWDGTFKLAYTNNPAWVYYDLLLHKRYGLGERITAAQVNKWELYQIGQYCDQFISDGKGGLEPRFTCNLYLQSRAEALKVLQDVAQIFRGMAYWANGEAVVVADRPSDPIKTYNNTDVIGGIFSYKSVSGVSQYNAALVTWVDMTDFGRTKTEYVEDAAEIARAGRVNKVELTATGCTSQGQAQRNGRYAIITNSLEDTSVTFTVGLTGAVVRPGHIIRVNDENVAGIRTGGRISAATSTTITSDSIGEAAVGDDVTVVLPNLKTNTRKIKAISGNVITVDVALDDVPVYAASWGYENKNLSSQRFRVTGVSEATEENTFTISALKHVAGKYEGVESGTRIDEPPISVLPAAVQPPPTNVVLTSTYGIEQTMAVSTMNITWDKAEGAIRYQIQWRKSDGNWVFAGETAGTEINIQGIYTGIYTARVMAISAFDNGSKWASSSPTALEGKGGTPATVTFLTATGIIMGMQLNWGFPTGSGDTLMTEIEYGKTNNPETMIKLGDFSYPANSHTMMDLGPGVRLFFRARLRDRSGNVGEWSEIATGLTENEAGIILDWIKGQIDESSIGKTLNERIDLIDGIGPGSVNERIEETKAELEELIQNVSDALEWVPTKAYLKGDIVRVGQKLYQATEASTNSQPPSAKWQDIGTILETANALATRVSTAEQSIVENKNQITATQQSLSAIVTKVNDPATGLDAVAGQVTTINQKVTQIDNKLTVTSEKVDGVYAEIRPGMAGETTSFAGSTEVYAGAWSVISAIAEGDFAQSERTNELVARVDDNYALITTVERTSASKIDSVAYRLDYLRANFESNSATVQTQIKAVSDANSSTASAVQTLQTTVAGNTTSIQQQSTITSNLSGKVDAAWSLRMSAWEPGVGYKMAGIGLGLATSAEGVIESRFIVSADQFAIYNINGGGTSVPFAVYNGITYIKSAFIQDGTINMLKIGDNLQSDNYVAGQTGWKLSKAGLFEINGSVPGQGKMTMTNRSLRVYDSNNIKRVQLGDLTE